MAAGLQRSDVNFSSTVSIKSSSISTASTTNLRHRAQSGLRVTQDQLDQKEVVKTSKSLNPSGLELELDRTSLKESVLVRTRTGTSQVQSEPDNVTNIDVFQRATAFHVVVNHNHHHALQQLCSRRPPVEQTTPPPVLPVQVSLDG